MWQWIRITLFRRPILSLFFLTTLLVCTGFLATAYLTAFLIIITLVTGTKSKTRESISLGQKSIPKGDFRYAEFTGNITAGIEGLVGRIDRLFERQERMEARVRGLIQEIEVIIGDGGALQHALPDSGGAAFPDPLPGSSIHTALTQPLDTLLDKLRSSVTTINRTGKTGDEIMRYDPDMTEVLKEWKERNEKVMDNFEKNEVAEKSFETEGGCSQ
ncbi:hypothetical protein BGX38DRAFT_286576 [Terfezia claveryi]|nr:hypothetical protein BGX38DRAFT_286576 [Terfezia claveryi]